MLLAVWVVCVGHRPHSECQSALKFDPLSASATLEGIEVAHMIRKDQFASEEYSPFQQFADLAA